MIFNRFEYIQIKVVFSKMNFKFDLNPELNELNGSCRVYIYIMLYIDDVMMLNGEQ